MQYVSIKKEVNQENGNEVFLVPALNLKNSKGATKQKIPHPLGDDYLEFETLEGAVRAIELSGFKYILPDGTKQIVSKEKPVETDKTYDELVYDALINQTKDINSSVVAAALTPLGELHDIKLLEIFIEKMGEENEAVRTSAINAILNFGAASVQKLLTAMKDENWVRRNSAIIAIQRLIDSESVNPEKLFNPLIQMTNDKNTIVKTSAILTLGKAYKLYKKCK